MSKPHISDCRTSNFDSSGSLKTVTYNTNSGSNAINTGTGIFTCPTKGIYQFEFGGEKVSFYFFLLFLHNKRYERHRERKKD